VLQGATHGLGIDLQEGGDILTAELRFKKRAVQRLIHDGWPPNAL